MLRLAVLVKWQLQAAQLVGFALDCTHCVQHFGLRSFRCSAVRVSDPQPRGLGDSISATTLHGSGIADKTERHSIKISLGQLPRGVPLFYPLVLPCHEIDWMRWCMLPLVMRKGSTSINPWNDVSVLLLYLTLQMSLESFCLLSTSPES